MSETKKTSLMTYGMYAGLGLLTGVVIYKLFAWYKTNYGTVAPALGGSKNAAGKMMVQSGRASWYCQDPQNWNKPQCNPTMRASYYCQDPKNYNKPECQGKMMVKANLLG